MIEYMGVEYDVPSEGFLILKLDTDGADMTVAGFKTEEDVLASIDSLYRQVKGTLSLRYNGVLKDIILDAFNTSYISRREEYLRPIVPTESSLVVQKQLKRNEINMAKKAYQSNPVKSNIGGDEYTFFGGLESARKYSEALDLALALGLESGKVLVEEGLVDVTEPDMKMALNAISLQVYKGWLKEQYYKQAVDTAKDVAEVDAIVWSDGE